MARSGRPCTVPTFLGFPAEECLHMVMSVVALHSVLSTFSGHMGLNTLVQVNVDEAESVATGLIPLLTSVDISAYFDDEIPQYQVLHRYLRPLESPPAPKAYSVWEVAGENLQSLLWQTLESSYSRGALHIMLNTVYAVLTYADRKLRVEPRAVVRLNEDGFPHIETGLACQVSFNISRSLL